MVTLKTDMETAINAGSIPVKPGTVSPGSSLAPKYDYLFDDEEDEQ